MVLKSMVLCRGGGVSTGFLDVLTSLFQIIGTYDALPLCFYPLAV